MRRCRDLEDYTMRSVSMPIANRRNAKKTELATPRAITKTTKEAQG